MTVNTTQPTRRLRVMLNKVPEVTIAFWIVKVLATTVGETFADFLSDTLNFGLTNTSIVMAVLLLLVLVVQFRARKYIPSVYWLAVVLISVVGTLASDNLVDGANVPLWVTTLGFAILLAATFIAWYTSERTLSIHTIRTTRRETYYWFTILFTFALGTSAGDLIAEKLNLGYFPSVLLFLGLIALVAGAHYFLRLGAVLSFWAAYVLTRPLGASLGDLLSQSRKDGGLGFGTTGTSVLFLAVIVVVVVGFTLVQRRRGAEEAADALADARADALSDADAPSDPAVPGGPSN